MSRLIRVDERLWQMAVAPEGILEWWFCSDGTEVSAGEKLAEIEIEGAVHEVVSPAKGHLQVFCFAGAVVDPGCILGQVT